MFNPDSINDLRYYTEKQIIDRKSARIAARDFSVPVVAMANADGGYLIVGIEDDGTITGIDDHFIVESPGVLPGMVRVDNIRDFHFSRNPKIVELLNEYDFVKEFGEGVDRIFRDMIAAGLPDPLYKQSEFMLYAELRNHNWSLKMPALVNAPQDTPQDVTIADVAKILAFCTQARSRLEIMTYMNMTDRKNFNRRFLKPLLDDGRLRMTLPDKPTSRYQKYIAVGMRE